MGCSEAADVATCAERPERILLGIVHIETAAAAIVSAVAAAPVVLIAAATALEQVIHRVCNAVAVVIAAAAVVSAVAAAAVVAGIGAGEKIIERGGDPAEKRLTTLTHLFDTSVVKYGLAVTTFYAADTNFVDGGPKAAANLVRGGVEFFGIKPLTNPYLIIII